MRKVKIACAQIDVRLGDASHNRDTIIEKLRVAAAMSAALVVFPECALTGFCYNSLDEAAPAAESREGPSAEMISEACRQEGVHTVYGYIEESGGKYYNAAMLIGPGGPVANYRKVHLPFAGVERFLTPGDQPFQVHDLPFGKVGINICYDTNFPETARVLKLLGAELIILPVNWPTGDRTAEYVVNVRANENHVNFIAVDRVGTERGWQFIGRSRVVDFNGDTVVEASATDEQLLIAEIDMEQASRNRIINVPGQYETDRIGDRRPEFYSAITRHAEKS
jgi:predicted amidohydrolase